MESACDTQQTKSRQVRSRAGANPDPTEPPNWATCLKALRGKHLSPFPQPRNALRVGPFLCETVGRHARIIYEAREARWRRLSVSASKRSDLATEIGLTVSADEVPSLRVETRIAWGAIGVPSRRPGRWPIDRRGRDYINRTRYLGHFLAVTFRAPYLRCLVLADGFSALK